MTAIAYETEECFEDLWWTSGSEFCFQIVVVWNDLHNHCKKVTALQCSLHSNFGSEGSCFCMGTNVYLVWNAWDGSFSGAQYQSWCSSGRLGGTEHLSPFFDGISNQLRRFWEDALLIWMSLTLVEVTPIACSWNMNFRGAFQKHLKPGHGHEELWCHPRLSSILQQPA